MIIATYAALALQMFRAIWASNTCQICCTCGTRVHGLFPAGVPSGETV